MALVMGNDFTISRRTDAAAQVIPSPSLTGTQSVPRGEAPLCAFVSVVFARASSLSRSGPAAVALGTERSTNRPGRSNSDDSSIVRNESESIDTSGRRLSGLVQQ